MGSPPLARERPEEERSNILGVGITPARAGKTSALMSSYAAPGDHPRSRGKDFALCTILPWLPGSPPLARERLFRDYDKRYSTGITPARAGKTRDTSRIIRIDRDHPRSRGKDTRHHAPPSVFLGSPPLARERPDGPLGSVFRIGITPARAGKTHPASQTFRRFQDHPRSRGKDFSTTSWLVATTGSPPLARERHGGHLRCRAVVGITPARAGKTQGLQKCAGIGWDHPRSRGKDVQQRNYGHRAVGSPPLARERPPIELIKASSFGITPARAGKTSAP